MVKEGVTTLDLENVAEKMMKDAGARPAFKNYFVAAVGQRYRFVLCTSVNDEVVVMDCPRQRVCGRGNIVEFDTGVELNGSFGDSAVTVPVGCDLAAVAAVAGCDPRFPQSGNPTGARGGTG